MKTIIELYENGMTLEEFTKQDEGTDFDFDFTEEEKVVSDLLSIDSNQIVFTTSDDDEGACREIFKQSQEEGSDGIFILRSINGVNFVYNYADGGLETIFIRRQDVSLIQEML